MSKHTPGPWVIKESATHVRVVGADDENIFHDDKSCPRVMGDAHLISAAPDLLVAGRMLIDSIEGGSTTPEEAITAILAAIAKATGE